MRFEAAARQLQMGPLELAAKLAAFVERFDQIWPDVEDGFVKSLRQMEAPLHFARRAERSPSSMPPVPQGKELPHESIIVVRYLHRHGHYGGRYLPDSGLQKRCHVADIDRAIAPLLELGLATRPHKRVVALIPSARARIEGILSNTNTAQADRNRDRSG
jgi:hypothetical protein